MRRDKMSRHIKKILTLQIIVINYSKEIGSSKRQKNNSPCAHHVAL